MDLLWDGIKFGLALSVLVGPLLFALIQTSIEQGFRAGWMVGWGIWISDVLFVLSTYFFISLIAELTKWDLLEPVLGVLGGAILISFGIGSLLSKAPKMEALETKAVRQNSYFSLWAKGFLLNTINPFSFFFWIGVSGLVFTNKNPNEADALYFYTGVIGTLVITDTAKVALAKLIRPWLKPDYILWMRRTVGVVFIVFGVVLLAKVFFGENVDIG